jgi:hypothetical protein
MAEMLSHNGYISITCPVGACAGRPGEGFVVNQGIRNLSHISSPVLLMINKMGTLKT